MINEGVDSLRILAEALDSLRIRYFVCGSVASSARGIFRATADVDLVVDMQPGQAGALEKALGKDWYADAGMISQAILHGRSFNVIHMTSAQKLDLFPATSDFHESELARATPVALGPEGTVRCPVASAEDTLLSKLRWYREGNEISERQWNDIAGIIAINSNLDLQYLRLWAARLRVTDLLDKALSQAG